MREYVIKKVIKVKLNKFIICSQSSNNRAAIQLQVNYRRTKKVSCKLLSISLSNIGQFSNHWRAHKTLYTQKYEVKKAYNLLQSTNVSKLVMTTMDVGCDCERENSHSFTPEVSQLNAKPVSSVSSQQKLQQNNSFQSLLVQLPSHNYLINTFIREKTDSE